MTTKFEAIESLYADRSELTLKIEVLKQKIAESNDAPAKYGMLAELGELYYRTFEIQDMIKETIEHEPEKPSIWNRLIHKK